MIRIVISGDASRRVIDIHAKRLEAAYLDILRRASAALDALTAARAVSARWTCVACGAERVIVSSTGHCEACIRAGREPS